MNVPERGVLYICHFQLLFSVSYPKMCIVECLIVQIWIVFFQAENKIPQCNFNWPKGGRLGHFSLPEQVFWRLPLIIQYNTSMEVIFLKWCLSPLWLYILQTLCFLNLSNDIYTFIGRNASVAKRGLMILYYFNLKYEIWFMGFSMISSKRGLCFMYFALRYPFS